MRTTRRGQGSVTIQDVARAAGVSAMTVSRVVNGGSNVREATRTAVRQAIQRLDYRPNAAARTLAGGAPLQIGLLYANPSGAYLSRFLIGALAEARRAGCHLVLEPCEGDGPHAPVDAAHRVARAGVQGVLLPPPLSESTAVHAALAEAELPWAAIAGAPTLAGRPSVRIDDRAAAATMTSHLLDLGHRRIGFIRGAEDHYVSHDRWDGFADALREAGLDPATMPVECGDFTYRSGLAATERLLASASRPTAIFASNDDMAAAAIGVAHRRGLSVPQDVTIVGYDDTALATTVWPELTTIRQPIVEMAEQGLAMLLDAVRGVSDAAPERMLDHELILRASSGPPPG